MSKNAGPESGSAKPLEVKPPKVESSKAKPPEVEKPKEKSELEKLGSVLAFDINQMMTIFGEFYDKMINFDFEKFVGISNPQEQMAALRKLEEKIKVPKINDADELKSNMEKAKPGDQLVAYLYKALGVPLPKINDIKPPTKEVKLQHLTKQLKDSEVYNIPGNKGIMERIKDKPSKFRVGDMVVLKGTDGSFTAGLVLAINENEVAFQNNKLSPEKRSSSEIFLAYHFNGNTKEIPKKLSS